MPWLSGQAGRTLNAFESMWCLDPVLTSQDPDGDLLPERKRLVINMIKRVQSSEFNRLRRGRCIWCNGLVNEPDCCDRLIWGVCQRVNDGRRPFCSYRAKTSMVTPIFFFLISKRNVSGRFWRCLKKIVGTRHWYNMLFFQHIMLFIREVKRTHETRRVRVRPESLVKHSWREEKRLSHSWRVADEYDVKKISLARRMPISSRCHFFLFRLEAYHEELNVHEEMFLLTLAVDHDETVEIDRECGGGEMLNLRMCVFIWRLGRWVSSDHNDSVFCKGETSTAIGMIKEKKKTDVQNWKKVKR